jgi:hypothetical protein
MMYQNIRRSRSTTVIIRLGFIILLSLILPVVVVRYSSEHGKLAIPPDYDDSHSLVEGGVRYPFGSRMD